MLLASLGTGTAALDTRSRRETAGQDADQPEAAATPVHKVPHEVGLEAILAREFIEEQARLKLAKQFASLEYVAFPECGQLQLPLSGGNSAPELEGECTARHRQVPVGLGFRAGKHAAERHHRLAAAQEAQEDVALCLGLGEASDEARPIQIRRTPTARDFPASQHRRKPGRAHRTSWKADGVASHEYIDCKSADCIKTDFTLKPV